MKIPLTWLRDYVTLPTDVGALCDRLTIAGLEIGSARFFGLAVPAGLKVKVEEPGPTWDREKIVTAQVVAVGKHPNADKLKIVTLDYGTGTPKDVVTGAPNLAVGETGTKVVLGLTGCTYFDGYATPKAIKELKPSVLRGVPSDAMVMSTLELGIDEEHEGIILLEADAPVGVPLVDFMGEVVLEADVLPNMARCLSLAGVAREVAALTGQDPCFAVPKPVQTGPSIAGTVTVSIAEPALCRRYVAYRIDGLHVGPAPAWMRRRLTYAGMRPINNLVDVTNYVMLETGQPLHAFDYDVLVGRAAGQPPHISVRPAVAGETLLTLDDQTRTLSPENLVIADQLGPIALAGVMGGKATEVTATTQNVLLEAAHFDFVSIRKSAQKFGLHSEASTRFSRGIHPEAASYAGLRALELLEQCGGVARAGAVEAYPAPLPPQVVALRVADIERLLGTPMPANEVERILTALDFRTTKTADGWSVTVPTTRTDIQAGAADLVEELGRVAGYDHLPSKLLSQELPGTPNDPMLAREEAVRDLLADLGLQETINYALTGREKEKPFVTGETYVELLNDISADRKVLRRSVLASVLDNAAMNAKAFPSVRLFEWGLRIEPQAGERLPDEIPELAIVLSGPRSESGWQSPAVAGQLDFYDLKGILESLAAGLHLRETTFAPTKDVAYLHPARAATWSAGELVLGHFGELHPRTAKALGLTGSYIVASIRGRTLLEAIPAKFSFTPIGRFPAALRDLAVVVAEDVPHDRVLAEIRAGGGELLRTADLFDIYRGESIPAGTKSLAFAVRYQLDDRTLKDAEVDKAHQKIEGRLKHMLHAKIRGKDL